MPTAAYCDQCQSNVYVTADGRCPQGHGPERLSGHYDAGDQTAPAAATPRSQRPMVKTARWALLIIVAVLLLALGCGLFACNALLSEDDSDVDLPETSSPATGTTAPAAETEGWYAEGAVEIDYVISRAGIEQSASEAMDRLTEAYPATTDDDVAAATDAYAALQAADTDARSLSAPAKYQAINDYFVAGLDLSTQGWGLAAANGFAQMDDATQAEAVSLIDQAASQFQQMDTAIAALEVVWGSE